MGFSITYKPLFEIRILHHYYLDKGGKAGVYKLFDEATNEDSALLLSDYRLTDYFKIEPTSACAKILQQYKFVFRILADRLVVLVKADVNSITGKAKPFVSLPSSLHFRFACRFADPYFTNYTSLPLDKENDDVYFFHNQVNGTGKTYPSLVAMPPKKQNGTLYSDGEILSTSTAPKKVLIANRLTDDNPPVQTFDNDPLVNGKPLFYVNRNDWQKAATNFWTYDTGAPDLSLTITVTNSGGDTVTPKQEVLQTATTVVQLNFAQLPEDHYTVVLKDPGNAFSKTLDIFLLKADGPPPDCLLDISVESDDDNYSLLDGDFLRDGNQVRSFELRFKNRKTLWRFLGEEFSNEPVDGPYLLTKHGFVETTIKNKDGKDVTDPPNPSVNIVRLERPASAANHYNLSSEIFIH